MVCDPRVGKVETNRAQGFAELDVSRTVRDPALPQKCGLHPRNDMQNCLSSDLHMHTPVHMNMHTHRERLGGRGRERSKMYSSFCLGTSFLPNGNFSFTHYFVDTS